MANKSKDGYLSRKEIREISRYNRKITSEIENKNKRKNVPEFEYVCEMKDSNNEDRKSVV